jgi:transketolase
MRAGAVIGRDRNCSGQQRKNAARLAHQRRIVIRRGSTMDMKFGPRRGTYIDIGKEMSSRGKPLSDKELRHFEDLDAMYRGLCAMLFNYASSGHPGGSISSGRFVAGLIFDSMSYDVSNPDREDADLISYAAGHKALGLYSMWALRNEVVRIGAPALLPQSEALQLRLEDLLGFRRNPITKTALFKKFHVKPLDGHSTPATPFVRLSTGASGVGVASSLGLAYGALDYYGASAPTVHIIEGEGGLTPGRVAEALAAAGTCSLKNAILHIDWNQASIDSNQVCRSGKTPGDYVQWNPMELAYLHDWNVIYVPKGMDFQQIIAAQRRVAKIRNDQPTAIVYRTVKGWKYGIEGRGSHGAGHSLCSPAFFDTIKPVFEKAGTALQQCANAGRCKNGTLSDILEYCFWDALVALRGAVERQPDMVKTFATRLVKSRDRLETKKRKPRKNAPQVDAIYAEAQKEANATPESLRLAPGTKTTLRGELGRVLQHYNKVSRGAILTASADLLGSTSANTAGKGFPEGYYHSAKNPLARTISVGGICEDGTAGIISGLASYGHHIGASSSYGAFIAPLSHIASRLHAIGNQARQAIAAEPYKPIIVICAHAGIKTGEDGPTHADPQPLQLLQENFPRGSMITLTPWDPAEVWTLFTAALNRRPAIIAPFVTRPAETIIDREAMGLAPVTAAATGVYQLMKAAGKADGTLVLQGSEVAYAFLEETLPLLKQKGIDLDVYYVASAELFDLLPEETRESVFPAKLADEALGISGFTLPTMYRWVKSEKARHMTLYPFKWGRFMGSGQAHVVLAEAQLNGEGQFNAIVDYLGR